MTKKRVELYRRLPEIYRIKDEDLSKLYFQDGQPVPALQLMKYLEPVEKMFSDIHENIESLYHDLFIEYADEWVIPYIADLLGTSHISGDAWTRRADVADTIALRRRKGTLGAIELLTFILTKWGVHSVELLENMVWNQHLNHQRPDEGGDPPYRLSTVRPATPRRGGTVSLRDPSLLAQLNTPFDPFAHLADVQPHETGQVRYNLPNLAIYLWRLEDYRLDVTKPHTKVIPPAAGSLHAVRVNIDDIPVNTALYGSYVKSADNEPEGRPVMLFNTNQLELFANKTENGGGLNPAGTPPRVSTADQVPGPIPRARISDFDIAQAYDDSLAAPPSPPLRFFSDASFTAPQEYLWVESYNPTFLEANDLRTLKISDVGLQLHLPEPTFAGEIWPHLTAGRNWKIRGESLQAWERELIPPLQNKEIVIDPERGRMVIGVGSLTRANALADEMLVTYTYGAVGPVGAHPVSYQPLPKDLDVNKTPTVYYRDVVLRDPSKQLQAVLRKALADVRAIVTGGGDPPPAIVIEIKDSRVHPFSLSGLSPSDRVTENGEMSILLHCPLIIRAADNQRPVVELARPLAFRPAQVSDADPEIQTVLDARMAALFVRLEGLYLARRSNIAPATGYTGGPELISRAALNKLEILSCTLDPGGFRNHLCEPAKTRATRLRAIHLREPYGFADAAEQSAFKQTPELVIQRSIVGAVFADEGYRLCIEDSIIESIPVTEGADEFPFALMNASQPTTGFAGPSVFRNVTIMGHVRVYSIEANGVIFTQPLQVFDRNVGCVKYSYFADDSLMTDPPGIVKNALPQNFACVNGRDARLIFTSELFGQPAYCQLSLECDRRILEEGVGSDQMGAFNFLQEAHKWRNLQIRFREFMPVGIRPLLIPVT
ncbi:MAG: hypothetical protein ACKVQW_09520 [Pyrinomonadaceae bacterium]